MRIITYKAAKNENDNKVKEIRNLQQKETYSNNHAMSLVIKSYKHLSIIEEKIIIIFIGPEGEGGRDISLVNGRSRWEKS